MSCKGLISKEEILQQESRRLIGIRHRVKKTAVDESRPTQVTVLYPASGQIDKFNLSSEQDEYDFVRTFVMPGDTIAMVLGGSGDNLAFALAKRIESLGSGTVLRIPPHQLKRNRINEDKDEDAKLLAQLAVSSPNLFYPVRQRDIDLINVREALSLRTDAMKERIACEQRLHQRAIGMIFRASGELPEAVIEDQFKKLKASDVILQALETEENRRMRELEKALERLDVYTQIFEEVEGCGAAIAARIIAEIVDIRRFENAPHLKAFMGAHVTGDGKAARRRRGQLNNWSPAARQALYLFSEQCVRRKESYWGLKYREKKVDLRQRHPEVIKTEKGTIYSDGHIHKMAMRWVCTKFVEWIFQEWWNLEREQSMPVKAVA